MKSKIAGIKSIAAGLESYDAYINKAYAALENLYECISYSNRSEKPTEEEIKQGLMHIMSLLEEIY